MYTLNNTQLTVTVLDPIADRERFGTRYCVGGYIFQVADARLGDLLSGPTYPDSFNVFDGQGLPEAFNLSPLRDASQGEDLALLLGIGVCDLKANTPKDRAVWTVDQAADTLTMRTTHLFGSYHIEVERVVTLHNRTVGSATTVRNFGHSWVPLKWFPHPFFPQPRTDELCKVNIPVQISDNPGYTLEPSGFIQRKGWPWTEGFFLPLDHNADTNLIVFQRHPKVGMVTATCSYRPDFFPIWGNPRTFSWEPFLERTIGAKQNLAWSVTYDF